MEYKFYNSSREYFLFFLVLAFALVSCSNSTMHQPTNAVKTDFKDTVYRKPSSTFSDTVIINSPSAVFYNADSLQLQKIKAITDSIVFESVMHECFYEMRYSRNVLKKNWPKIKIVDIMNVRYVLFKSANGTTECIDLNTKNNPCGIIVFNGHKKAKLLDMPNVDSELGFYFSD